MPAESPARRTRVRDWLETTVESFNRAELYFGHGSTNAYDEAAYLLLHTLTLPLHELDPILDRLLSVAEIGALDELVRRRIEERVPAAYLTHEAWLGDSRFYVDERVIVPRSFIAELLRDELYPWMRDDQPINKALDLCTGSGCLAILLALAFPDAAVDATDLSTVAGSGGTQCCRLWTGTAHSTYPGRSLFGPERRLRSDRVESTLCQQSVNGKPAAGVSGGTGNGARRR